MNPGDNNSNAVVFITAIPLAICLSLIIIVIFQYESGIPNFSILYWVIFPIIAYVISVITNVINQYSECDAINTGKAFLSALPLLAIILVSLGISTISFCRIPIASAFSSFVSTKPVDIVSSANITNKQKGVLCCTRMSLEQLELVSPAIKGISVAFYVMFGTLFGQVIASSLSRSC